MTTPTPSTPESSFRGLAATEAQPHSLSSTRTIPLHSIVKPHLHHSSPSTCKNSLRTLASRRCDSKFSRQRLLKPSVCPSSFSAPRTADWRQRELLSFTLKFFCCCFFPIMESFIYVVTLDLAATTSWSPPLRSQVPGQCLSSSSS